MARKTHEDAFGVAGAETIIGTGVVVHGDLTSQSDITIDGFLKGKIKTEGNLTLGVNAQVTANIEATNVVVAGSLEGNITARGETTIRETGQVKGDITSLGLAISSGGVFIGRSLMESPPQLEQSVAQTDPESANHTDHHSRKDHQD
jgi:cytoskeletal protein CcmA (bactofilin family)